MNLLLQVGLGNAIAAAALAVPAALASWFGRKPALTHALWLLVLLKLLTPPFYPLPINGFETRPSEPVQTAKAIQGEENLGSLNGFVDHQGEFDDGIPPPGHTEPQANASAAARELEPVLLPESERGERIPWEAGVATIWLAGSLSWFGLASIRLLRFHRMLRHARPADDALVDRTRALSAALGLSKAPAVWLVPGHVSPMLWAFAGRANLILPRELLARLTLEQGDALLAHELAHLRRRDHWVRVLEFLATGLFWWHPVLWWARREIREAEEQCCDAWVVWALPAVARGYALALVETVDFLSEVRPALPPVASGVGHVHDLRRRMTMIMRGTTPRGLTWGGALLVLGVAAFMLPMLPTLAQTPPGQQRGDSSPEEDFKRAQEALQRAKSRLEQAQVDRAKKREDHEAAARSEMRNDVCLRCHQNLRPEKSEAKERFENLHSEIVKLTTTLEHQRAEVKTTEARLQAVLKKLDELTRSKEARDPQRPESPRPETRPGGPLTPDGRGPSVPPGRGGDSLTPGDSRFGPGRGPGDPEDTKRNDELPAELKKRIDMEKHNQERIQELTNQMEKLLKEMEKMRKELHDRGTEKPRKEVPPSGSSPDDRERRLDPAKP
jgi:beta-lactamase regulating signal transducer with metallopeptidase domain